MKSFFVLLLIFISAFLFSIAESVQAQDEGDPGKQTSVKRRGNVKAQNDKRDRLSADLGFSAGWVSNIFKTPSREYVDPVTGTPTTSQAQGGTLVSPKAEFKFEPIQKKRVNLNLSYEFEGDFYFGPANAANASGNDQEIATKSKLLLVDRKNRGLEKVYVKVGAYVSRHDYSYYHRGTGEVRTTASLTDVDDRYKRIETGFEMEPSFRFSTDTQIDFPLNFYSRNYDEVGTLQSYDRNGQIYGVQIKQEIQRNWSAKVAYNSENVKYDKYEALDSGGASVNGTIREYVDQEYLIGVNYDSKLMFGEIAYRSANRNDLYADYGSYEQEKISLEIGCFVSHSSSISLEGSLKTRRYQNQTAPSGAIRKRENQALSLSYEKSWRWGETSLEVAHSVQDDTDRYYQYSKDAVMLGYNKEF